MRMSCMIRRSLELVCLKEFQQQQQQHEKVIRQEALVCFLSWSSGPATFRHGTSAQWQTGGSRQSSCAGIYKERHMSRVQFLFAKSGDDMAMDLYLLVTI
eukprot:948125-Pelagomonas_calceolata.AAC.2